MAKLSREDILKLAKLARLRLGEDEISAFQHEISEILTYVELLDSADTDGLKPTYQITGLSNVAREDTEINYGTDSKMLFKNAPASQGAYLKVKRMIG